MWTLGRAAERAEVHHGRVEAGGIGLRQEILADLNHVALAACGVEGCSKAEDAREYALHVAVDGGARLIEGERGNGSRRVVAYASQPPQLFECMGKCAAPLHHLTRGSMEVAGTAVVTQTLPQAQNFVLGRFSQCLHVGEARDEAQVVVAALADARLLQDDLAHPNAVGVGGIAPRQCAPVFFVPTQKGFGEHGGGGEKLQVMSLAMPP